MAQRHLDRLTSFDTSFLANEKANGHMAIGALLMCEGTPPEHEDFLAHIRSRVHLLPRLRQRLAYPPLSLGTPFWVDYPDFDIHRHVRTDEAARARHRGPVPGARRRAAGAAAGPLQAALGAEPGRRLRRRPLRRSSTRPTTRWPTGSPRSTSACCSSTSSRSSEPVRERGPLDSRADAFLAGAAAVGPPAGCVATLAPSQPLAAAGRRRSPARARTRRSATASRASGRSPGTWPAPAPKVPFNPRHRPPAQLRLDNLRPGRFQARQELARRHRQRRLAGRRQRRPAALAAGARGAGRRGRAEGAGAGLDPDRKRARRAR